MSYGQWSPSCATTLGVGKTALEADKSTLFVSPKPGAARAACAAHRLQGCAGAKVPAPSPAPAAATAALSQPPWLVPNFRKGKHAPSPTLQQELLQIYKFFLWNSEPA